MNICARRLLQPQKNNNNNNNRKVFKIYTNAGHRSEVVHKFLSL